VLEARIAALGVAATAPACGAWLRDLSAALAASADVLLAPAEACAELGALETVTVGAIRDWAGPAGVAVREGAARWDDVAELCLGRRAALWPEVFETALVARASTLVVQRFKAAADGLDAPLRECLAGAAAAAAEPARRRVADLAAALDDAMRGALADALTLMSRTNGAAALGGSLARSRSLGAGSALLERRAATLQGVVQDSAAAAARSLASALSAHLDALPATADAG